MRLNWESPFRAIGNYTYWVNWELHFLGQLVIDFLSQLVNLLLGQLVNHSLGHF
jgi:hypothetical protein